MFPTVRSLVLAAFHCWLWSLPMTSAPWNFLVTRLWVNSKGRKKVKRFPPQWVLGFSFMLLHPSFSCTSHYLYYNAHFQLSKCIDFRLWAICKEKMVNSLMVQGCIQFWYPSLIHLLFAIQSSQMAEPSVLLRFYSWAEAEKKMLTLRVCNWNGVAHIICKYDI